MADGVALLSLRMRDNLFIADNGLDSVETASQGSRDETIERDSGFIEDRFRVDRKKLERMLQLVPASGDEIDEGAEDFFQRVMDETNTQITWPSKLKIGAKSKKDPHIKVIGFPDNVDAAKITIMTVLDTKSNRVTLKMDVSHTEHSHVIGKGGNNIKRVMTETNCHIHFPDSNRGNNSIEKSNQVSLAGQPEGVESARKHIRDLLPLVFMFELPVTSPLTPVPDINSPLVQQLQQSHAVTITFKQRFRASYSTTAIIRGSVYSAKGVQLATTRLMEQLTGSVNLSVSMQMEIAPQHHLFIIGRGGVNIKHIMQCTGANILFPDPNSATPQRKGTVFITGTIDSVFLARQYLIGCLPLVLMFDVKESIELDQGRVTQLMEKLDVYISVKPKPRQPSKSVIVKSIERNAANMYLAREVLLGLKSDAKISAFQAAHMKKEAGLIGPTALSLASLGVLAPSVVSVNTTNFLLSGHPSPSVITSPHYTTTSPPASWIHSAQTPTVYSPIMVVTPGATTTALPGLEMMPSPFNNNTNTNNSSTNVITTTISSNGLTTTTSNGLHHDLTISPGAIIRVPTPLDHLGTGPGSATSDTATSSPLHSPCISPTTFGICNAAADLAKLPTVDGSSLDDVLSPKVSPAMKRVTTTAGTAVSSGGYHHHHPHLQQHHNPHHLLQHQQYLSQQQADYLSQHHHNHHHHPGQPYHQHHLHQHHLHPHHHQSSSSLNEDVSSKIQSLKLVGLNKTASLSQLTSLGPANAHPSSALFNGIGHSQVLLNGSQVRDSPSPPDPDLSEKLAPGIERKNSSSSLYSSALPFGFDYEQKKLLAMKAMQKKPEGESRIPTDIWSGMGFSKSMPESAIREKLGRMGKSRCMNNDIMGYESPRPEIDLTIDQDLWNNDPHPDSSPGLPSCLLNKAPGEYPSPRKKIHYGLSHSNHVDSASLPQNKSVWATKTDLAELFSALGLSKYTDLFQQQEIDLSTFLTLSDLDLRELGITTFGARRKMLLAIADLNKRRTMMPSSSVQGDGAASRMGSSLSVDDGGGSPSSSNGHHRLRHHSPVGYPGTATPDARGGELLSGGNSASELFPSPSPPSSLMNPRSNRPGLGASSGHW